MSFDNNGFAPKAEAKDQRSQPKTEWVAPSIRRMKAGDAENGFGSSRADGQFTTS